MSKALLFLALPMIAWLIYKSEQWEEGEWIKKQTRKTVLSAFEGMKTAKRYFTDPDFFPERPSKSDGVVVKIGEGKKK